MARIRSIKPEFWASEQVGDCSRDARLLFIGLWNFCDDGGVHKLSLGRIRSEVFPADDDITSPIIRRLVGELVSNGLVGIFEHETVEYIHILGWAKHQKIEKPTYKHPKPPKNPAIYKEWSSNDRQPTADLFDDRSTPDVDVDVEGKGCRRDNPPSPLGRGGEQSANEPGAYPAKFDALWQAYPSRGQAANPKKPALKAWNAALKRGADPDELVRLAPSCAAAEKHGTEFVPQLATWLNQDRWKQKPNGANGQTHVGGTGWPVTWSPDEQRWGNRYLSWKKTGKWIAPGDAELADTPPHVRQHVDQMMAGVTT